MKERKLFWKREQPSFKANNKANHDKLGCEMEMTFDLHPMLYPSSIAFIGASGGKGKINAIPLQSLKAYGYTGKVYPVNPNYDEIEGFPCYRSIESLPENIDLAIVSVGAPKVLPALEMLAERKIRSAVVFSSGFSEAGEEGKKLQDELAAFARRANIPVCGPNSIGIINLGSGATASFAKVDLSKRDPVGFITQSGAIGTCTYELAKEIGLGYDLYVSTGNEAVVDFFDYAQFFAGRDDLKVIGGYIEGARDIERMEAAIEAAHNHNKPMVLMKVGNSKKGAEAAASHTSSLAGNQSVYASFFKQNNVVQVTDEEELIDTLSIFTKAKVSPARGGVAIVTLSGGAGIIMVDKCEEYGVELADLTPETVTRLKELLPSFASVQNPVDVSAQIFQHLNEFLASLEVLLADDHVEAVVFYMQIGHHLRAQLVPGLINISKHTSKTLVVCWAGASQETREELFANGVCWLPTPSRAIRALKNFLHYHKNRDDFSGPGEPASARRTAGKPMRGIFTEIEGKRMIAEYGIPVPEGKLARSADEAVQIAGEMGYPVVLKAVSKDIMHKSDVGGVMVNLAEQSQVTEAYRQITANCLKHKPDAGLDGILVEKMAKEGTEAFIGCFQDPLFGPCVMFGLGGVYIEVLEDVVVRKAPLTRKDAMEMVQSIKGYKILAGTRGKKPSDIEALVAALVQISHFCWEHRDDLKELDINPLMVYEEGQGVLALDALIIGRGDETSEK